MNAIRHGRRPAVLAATVIAGAGLLAGPMAPAVHAQDPLGAPVPDRERARERDVARDGDRERCICFDGEMGRAIRPIFTHADRGRLGVMLGEPEEVGGEAGVRVAEVVEGGPADRAGIAAGDVLLSVDGDDLGDAPTRALLEHMETVEPGDTVTVRLSRAGRVQTARVVAERDAGFSFFSGDEGPRVFSIPRVPGPARVPRPESFITIDAFGHGGLELVEMNEGLGRYFDVEAGVLVADVEEDSRLGLQAGDVIVAIGDRDVRSPRHARSIIGSYLPDEEITFRVVRDGRTITVRGTRER